MNSTSLSIAALILSLVSGLAQAPPPVPKPFPQPGQPSTSTPAPPRTQPPSQAPAGSVPPPQTSVTSAPVVPNEAMLGAPIFPASEFLESYDAGKGQRYYLFGSNSAYAELLAFYKTALRTDGRKLFDSPPMQQFDLPGTRFQEQTMVFPPSVVVKDYTWNGSEGYLHVDGVKEKRFRTIVQIVPAPAR